MDPTKLSNRCFDLSSISVFKMVSCKVFIVLCLLTTAIQTSKGASLRVTNLTCYSDPTICTDVVCERKFISRGIFHYTVGCTPVRVVGGDILLRTAMLKKTNSGLVPSLLDVTHKYCELRNQNSDSFKFMQTMMENFAAGYFEKIERQTPPCPIKDKWSLEYETIPSDSSRSSTTMASIIPFGQYVSYLRAYDKINATLFEVNIEFIFRK